LFKVLVTREPTFLSRSLNVSLPRAILAFSVAWWKQSPSQAALVFGLLRYARNDKNQDRHTTFAMTIHNTHDRPGVSAPIYAVELYQQQHRLWFHAVIKLTKTKKMAETPSLLKLQKSSYFKKSNKRTSIGAAK
jgi:hypothetical protein